MSISLQKGLREFKSERLEATNGELTGKVLDVKSSPSITEILRDLTDEEAEIINNQFESESIETGVKLF